MVEEIGCIMIDADCIMAELGWNSLVASMQNSGKRKWSIEKKSI